MTEEHVHYTTRNKRNGYQSPFWFHTIEAALSGEEPDEVELISEPCHHDPERFLTFTEGAS